MQMRRNRFRTGPYLRAALVVAAAPIWCSGLTSLFAEPATNATTATYVTTAEIDAALQQMPPTSTTYDKPIKTVDRGRTKSLSLSSGGYRARPPIAPSCTRG